MMTTPIKSIAIKDLKDIPELRYMARVIMQECHTSLREQIRVSWFVDYLARQMLLYGEQCSFDLVKVEVNEVMGLRIICSGTWPHYMKVLFKHHIMPMASAQDEIEFVQGATPQLKVTTWAR
jgi:hypothetical protein